MVKKKKQKLQTIADEIVEKNICPELRKGATQLVFADGNPNANIVFIGEAPGKNEDQQGLPFVGAAGKFLNEMLELIGLRREDIYITNIVKYRPPNNRDPLPEEKKAFWPYLVRQLDVIQPKLVVTLGRHSMEYFLPGSKISAVHGEPQTVRVKSHEPGVMSESTRSVIPDSDRESSQNSLVGANQLHEYSLVILPLFHPAAALYNGGLRQTLVEDFSKIPTILKKI